VTGRSVRTPHYWRSASDRSAPDRGNAPREGLTDGPRVLNAAYYGAYAKERMMQARLAYDTHRPSPWTGCCVGCGRPAPCEERLCAEQTLTSPEDL
jgi:hypothetical protein